jgi:hypothetical protein
MRSGTRTSSCLLVAGLLLVLMPMACGRSDPRREALDEGMSLAYQIVVSDDLLVAVRNADPGMHASTAAGAALSGGVVAGFRSPPEGIGLQTADQPIQGWNVVIRADDAGRRVILEGYGDDLRKPLVTRAIDYPPR